MTSFIHDFLAALRFLTRIPVPSSSRTDDSLPPALKFFPVIGALIGCAAALVHALLEPHLPPLVTALLTVSFLVIVTGCLHEDGLADAADGFGGGWARERILEIMRDSRIGTYGAAALILSLLARVVLIAALPAANVTAYLIASQTLCRWTTLPLSYFLSSAREGGDGLGSQVARLTSAPTLIFGSLFPFALVASLLRFHAAAPIGLTVVLTFLSGLYYRRRLQGVTGDCFGATNQLTEIGVYLCGVWVTAAESCR